MMTADRVIDALRAKGELLVSVDGSTGLRGDVLHLYRWLEARILRVAAATDTEPCEEWLPPAAMSLNTLARASYFASFPQWLTLASHLEDDAATLERIASSAEPASDASRAAAPAGAALPPAVCYHVYAGLADRTLAAPAFVSAQCTCWRHEGDRTRSLARGWSFTMREGVCVGDAVVTAAFRTRGAERASAFADSLGLHTSLVEATDPFFAPTARGRLLLQKIKGLKQELMLDIGGESVAGASFNLHDDFFGLAFAIATADGAPAHSACVAYGIDRWLLAFLVAHGTDARNWPALENETCSLVMR